MRRIAVLSVVVMTAAIVSLLTLRQARSHFDLNFWYMLTSGACYVTGDVLMYSGRIGETCT